MMYVISPAKSMDFALAPAGVPSSAAQKMDEMQIILHELKKMSVPDIMDIMKVSKKIAELNCDRFDKFDKLTEKQALFAYSGDVYNNIDTSTLNDESIGFAQEHLRILSALYGLLRPLDKIRAYRLEMSCRLKNIAPKGMNIFWRKAITENLNKELAQHKSQFLVNIASNEYSDAIDAKSLNAEIINVHFREIRDGELKNIALNAKRARGMMADFVIRNQLDTPEAIKEFGSKGYSFDKSLSDSSNFYFICK